MTTATKEEWLKNRRNSDGNAKANANGDSKDKSLLQASPMLDMFLQTLKTHTYFEENSTEKKKDENKSVEKNSINKDEKETKKAAAVAAADSKNEEAAVLVKKNNKKEDSSKILVAEGIR